MPSLSQLTDAYQPDGVNAVPYTANGAPNASVDTIVEDRLKARLPDVGESLVGDGGQFSAGTLIGNRLFGTGGQERYQTWPERLVTDAVTGAHKVMTGEILLETVNPDTGVIEPSQGSIQAAFNMAALGGTGGLAGAEEGVLGAGPFLRPAMKYEDKIYKAPVKDPSNPLFFGAEHSDAIPAHLAPDFYKKAMSGEDINDYKFGFTNHKGQFMNREDATDYAAKEGLADPRDIAYNGGILTSTMMSDTSKPGMAIEAQRPYKNVPDSLMGFKKSGQNKGFDETNYKYEQPVSVTFPDTGDNFIDSIKGLNQQHALERAYRNWKDAIIKPINNVKLVLVKGNPFEAK